MLKFLKSNFELIFWIAALVALGFSDPTKTHYVLCPLRLMGFNWCPGCGIGHSISFLMHGNVGASFHAHWFGIPALGILIYRIGKLMTDRYREYTDHAISTTHPTKP